jgi:hypothetical protein
LADAVGDICNDGDEAVWGDESEAISPVNERKGEEREELVRLLIEIKVSAYCCTGFTSFREE